MEQRDANSQPRTGLSKTLAVAAVTGATAMALVLPGAVAYAEPVPPPPPGTTTAPPPPADPNAPPPAPLPRPTPTRPPPAVAPNAPPPPAVAPNAPAPPPPPADPNAPPVDPNAPPVDPNAPPPPPPPPPPPEPGRVDNAAGGFSYVVPAGWKVADATQLSYGQALLTKIPQDPTAQPPTDTSVLLGRLDLKLFAGAETDNTKAAQRLASDMGEFFMPFPGTRINQATVPLNANGMSGVASYYEVKFTDTNKPTGQIWAGVVGAPTPPVPRAASGPPSDGLWCGSVRPTTRWTRKRLSLSRSRSGSGLRHHRHRRHRYCRRTQRATTAAGPQRAATAGGPQRARRRTPTRRLRGRVSECRFR